MIALDDLPGARRGVRRDAVAVGDLRAAAVAVEVPAVERTADRLADHAPAFREMRAEVRAVAVEHLRLAAARAEQHQLLVEVARQRRTSPATRSRLNATANQPFGIGSVVCCDGVRLIVASPRCAARR